MTRGREVYFVINTTPKWLEGYGIVMEHIGYRHLHIWCLTVNRSSPLVRCDISGLLKHYPSPYSLPEIFLSIKSFEIFLFWMVFIEAYLDWAYRISQRLRLLIRIYNYNIIHRVWTKTVQKHYPFPFAPQNTKLNA